jgi:hypothetical protein
MPDFPTLSDNQNAATTKLLAKFSFALRRPPLSSEIKAR